MSEWGRSVGGVTGTGHHDRRDETVDAAGGGGADEPIALCLVGIAALLAAFLPSGRPVMILSGNSRLHRVSAALTPSIRPRTLLR